MAIKLCQNCQRPYGADLEHDDEYCKTVDPVLAKKAVEERYAAMTAARERMRKAKDSRLPEKGDGTCKDCHASLNNMDPDDHKCRDYDKDESPVLRRELGRTDARTQIWN